MMRTTIVQSQFSPLVSKVMERVIQVQLFSFLDDNKVLSAFNPVSARNIPLKLRLFTLLTDLLTIF